MRRLCVAFVVLTLGVVACGKSRLTDDDPGSGSGWDDPTAANGFHADADRACDFACIPKDDGATRKHAVRTSPEPHVVAALEEPSAGLLPRDGTILGASTHDWASGWSWAFEPESGSVHRVGDHGPPSAIAITDTKRMYLATRDSNGHSSITSGREIIAAGETDVRALVVHDEEACWIDANERVRCGHDAASVRTVAHAPGLDARFLAMDDEALYVARHGWIARLAFGASSLETLAKIESPIRDLALAHGWLYWTELGEPRLECQPDGTMPSCTARGRTVRHPFGTLRRVRIGDRHASLVAKDLEAADGILLARDVAYVSTARGLLRASPDGSSTTLLPTADPAFGRPALDPVSSTVYVQTRKKADPPRLVALDP